MGSNRSIPEPGRAAYVDPDVMARLERLKTAAPKAMPRVSGTELLFPDPVPESENERPVAATPLAPAPTRTRPTEKLVISYRGANADAPVLKFSVTLQVEEVVVTQVAFGFLYDPQKFSLELTISEEYAVTYRGQAYAVFYCGGYLPFKTIYGLHLLTFVRNISRESKPAGDGENGAREPRE